MNTNLFPTDKNFKMAIQTTPFLFSLGGGPCNVKSDDSCNQISAMVSTQIQPLKNPFDCDAGPDDNLSEGSLFFNLFNINVLKIKFY